MRTRRLNRDALPAKIIDYLTTHGGWHTTGALAAISPSVEEELHNHPVQRALMRLRDDGLIEGRPTGPRCGPGSPQYEWRATEEADQWL